MRIADFGMRIGKGSSGWRLDLPFPFRNPQSTIRILFLLCFTVPAEAQVDPSGSWRTLHTPHFRIHFRPAYRDAALLEAREAERSYGLLATELHPPRGIVDITLADDIDAANGLTTVAPTNRITIFAAPPAGDHGLLFFDNWLPLVRGHEPEPVVEEQEPVVTRGRRGEDGDPVRPRTSWRTCFTSTARAGCGTGC